MGSCFSRRGQKPEPSVEFWPDKVIKYAVVPPILLAAIIALILLHAVDRVNCAVDDPSRDVNPLSDVNLYCWHRLRPAAKEIILNYTIWNHTLHTTPPPGATTVTYDEWIEGPTIYRHKLFPILLICECVCLAMPLFLWYWCISGELRSHTKAVIAHANSLTDAYKKYDKSLSSKDEAAVHRELDNYLEYLSYLLSCKARRLYILQLVKWIVMLVICVAWFGGNLGLFSPDFDIFLDSFTCLYDKRSKLTYTCIFPTSLYLRIVWYVNLVVLGILIILIILYIIIELCLPRKYRNTFLHGGVPGAMDGRLANCVQRNHNPRHYWLISKLCEENEGLCDDPGMARSLARKYGTRDQDDKSNGEKDQRPAFVKQSQVDRFENSVSQENSSPVCCGSCFGNGNDNVEPSSKISPRSGTDFIKWQSDEDMRNAERRDKPPMQNGNEQEEIGNKQKWIDEDERNKNSVETRSQEVKQNGIGPGMKRNEVVLIGQPSQPVEEETPYNNTPESFTHDYTPEHLYFRELIRYKHPKGIKPEYPVDYAKPKPQGNPINGNSGPDQPYNTWTNPSRKGVFTIPNTGKRDRVQKRRRARISTKDPDVIVLEDIEEYTHTSPRESGNNAVDKRQIYKSPYSGPLSSRVIMPYYDSETGTYKDLNPLAFKLRQTVRQKMAENAKVWRP